MIGLLAWCGRSPAPTAFNTALDLMREESGWAAAAQALGTLAVAGMGPADSIRRSTDPRTGRTAWVDGRPRDWSGREIPADELHRAGTASWAGHFAAVVHDPSEPGPTVVTDPWGSRILYQIRTGDGWIVASDLHAVFASGLAPRQLDESFAYPLLRLIKCRLGERTLLRNVDTIPAASAVRYGPDGQRTIQPLAVPEVELERRSEEEWVERIAPLLRRAVERSPAAGRRTALALSGGLDSRLLLAAMSPDQRKQTPLVTCGNPRSQEVLLAHESARVVGCTCHTVPLGPLDFIGGAPNAPRINEEFDIVGQSGVDLMHRAACRFADALMTGWDVDVELRGTYTSTDTAALGSEDELVALVQKKWGLYARENLGELLRPEFIQRHADPTDALLAQCLDQARCADLETTYLRFIQMFEKRRLLMLRCRLIRRHMESALPFYDPELQLALRAIPEDAKRGNRLMRALLLRLSPELADVPYQRTMRPASAPLSAWAEGAREEDLKEKALRQEWARHRTGVSYERYYSNFDEWLMTDPHWDAALRGYLLDPKSPFIRDVARPEAVARLVAEHRSGERNRMSLLVVLLSLAAYWADGHFEVAFPAGTPYAPGPCPA